MGSVALWPLNNPPNLPNISCVFSVGNYGHLSVNGYNYNLIIVTIHDGEPGCLNQWNGMFPKFYPWGVQESSDVVVS